MHACVHGHATAAAATHAHANARATRSTQDTVSAQNATRRDDGHFCNVWIAQTREVRERNQRAGVADTSSRRTRCTPNAVPTTGDDLQYGGVAQAELLVHMHDEVTICPAVRHHYLPHHGDWF